MNHKSLKTYTFQRTALVMSAVLLLAAPAIAQDVCTGIEVEPTAAITKEYADLTAEALKESSPGPITVEKVLVSGAWSVAYIVPQDLDPGYAFFEDTDGKKIFKEVWGGLATVSEQPETAKWAETLGAPADLAACFASLAASAEDDE